MSQLYLDWYCIITLFYISIIILKQDLYFNRSDTHFFSLELNKSIEPESVSDIDVKETLIIQDISYSDSSRSCRALSVYLW